MKQIYTCKSCKFTFEYKGKCDRCPDCGKDTVMLANDKEREEYMHRMDNDEY